MSVSTFALAAVLAAVAPTPQSMASVSWPAKSESAETSPGMSPKYKVKRHDRSPEEVVARAKAFLGIFGADGFDDPKLLQWAKASLRDPTGRLQVHPVEDRPGLVISYNASADDLMLMDLTLLRSVPELEQTAPPVEVDVGIGEVRARETMEELVSALIADEILPDGYHPELARVGTWRDIRRSKDGSRAAEWVTEYQFTMNRVVGGVEFIDAGVRLGIHRDGRVSSIRVTDAQITPVGTPTPMLVDISAARRAFIDAESRKNPEASVRVIRERVAVVLDLDASEEVMEPCVLFNYALEFESPATGESNLSRQQLSTVSLVDGTVHQVFPELQEIVPQ